MIIKRCSICHSLADNNCICNDCLNRIRSEYIDTYMDRCPVCFYPLVDKLYSCRHSPFKIFCISDYKSLFSRRILFDLKFHGKKQFAPIVAKVFKEHMSNWVSDNAVLVPVPCSPSSLKKRGWNHMELVAKKLKGWKYLNLLSVNGNSNVQQKTLNREQRYEASKNKFEINSKVILPDLNTPLVLLDDIMTTGATLEACRNTLLNAGFTSVSAITWLIDY